MIVEDAGSFELRDQLLGGRPGWCGVALWLLAAELRQDLDAFVENCLLLLC